MLDVREGTRTRHGNREPRRQSAWELRRIRYFNRRNAWRASPRWPRWLRLRLYLRLRSCFRRDQDSQEHARRSTGRCTQNPRESWEGVALPGLHHAASDLLLGRRRNVDAWYRASSLPGMGFRALWAFGIAETRI